MGGGEIAALVGVSMVVLVVKVALLAAVVLAVVTRTTTGRRMFGLKRVRDDESALPEIEGQIQALQAQLDDVYTRLDFAERVMLEQREQLHALGAPAPQMELREPTPV